MLSACLFTLIAVAAYNAKNRLSVCLPKMGVGICF